MASSLDTEWTWVSRNFRHQKSKLSQLRQRISMGVEMNIYSVCFRRIHNYVVKPFPVYVDMFTQDWDIPRVDMRCVEFFKLSGSPNQLKLYMCSVLYLPVSNVFVDFFFPVMKSIWTDERNRMRNELVKRSSASASRKRRFVWDFTIASRSIDNSSTQHNVTRSMPPKVTPSYSRISIFL